MHDPLPEHEDKRLEMLFRRDAEPVADDGFSDAVMRQVAQRAWRRRILLAAAGAAGALVAFQPAWHLASAFSRELVLLGARWPELAFVLQTPYALGAGLLFFAVPALAKWVEE